VANRPCGYSNGYCSNVANYMFFCSLEIRCRFLRSFHGRPGAAPLSPSLLAAHAWTAQHLYKSTPSIDSRTPVMHTNHQIHYIMRGSPSCHHTPSSSSQRLSRFLSFLLLSLVFSCSKKLSCSFSGFSSQFSSINQLFFLLFSSLFSVLLQQLIDAPIFYKTSNTSPLCCTKTAAFSSPS
jgi:hypothetical protein